MKQCCTRVFLVIGAWFFQMQAEVCFKPLVQRSGYFVSQIVVDALDLNYNLFSRDSAKIITGFVPFYLITRSMDENIQCNFYDASCHKNINQFPQHCHTASKVGVGVPMVFLSSLALFGWTDDIQYTGRMTAIGLPFVHSGKDIIKQAQAGACLRPWHQDFGRKKRSSGGFPSGHMANVTYMATLWGLRHGPRWAIPLSFMAAFVFADFVNQNRHYVSQMVAGAALGVLYGVAANRVVENRLCGNFSFSVVLNDQRKPCCQMGYSF